MEIHYTKFLSFLIVSSKKEEDVLSSRNQTQRELAFHSKGNMQGVAPDRPVVASFLRATAHTLRHVT